MKKVYIVYNLLSNEILREARVCSSRKKANEYILYKTSVGYNKEDFIISEKYIF